MLTKKSRKQRTLGCPVSFSGIGIHTGKNVDMRFVPAAEGKGIFFKRIDLGSLEIPANVNYVVDTSRNTTIGKENASVHTIEHVMAALKAFNIDNLCIELNNVEPPVGNGSSDVFVNMIEQAGIMEQNREKEIFELEEPIFFSTQDIQLIAVPSDSYRLSYTLSYPEHPILKAQFHSVTLTSETFKNEIASCRTFSLYQEISYLIDKGLIKGGSLDNAVVIHSNAVFSKGGLFFENEMVRHKILDLIGDLALIEFDLLAHVISIRSGHATNYAFAKQITNAFKKELINARVG